MKQSPKIDGRGKQGSQGREEKDSDAIFLSFHRWLAGVYLKGKGRKLKGGTDSLQIFFASLETYSATTTKK